MTNLFWRLVARLLARPAITTWLIARAKRTPYLHIRSKDGLDLYMGRWWLLNPYSRETHEAACRWFPWSIRVHHIIRPDDDRDPHDHPWNARTIILRGWYTEERRHFWCSGGHTDISTTRRAGSTATLMHGEYHRIDEVSPGGVYTLFITGPWQGDWGFLVKDVKVPWKTYTGDKS